MYKTTDKELKIIKEYILLPFLFSVMDRDLKTLFSTQLKIKKPYLDLLENCMHKVTRDFSEIKKEMDTHGIKLYEELKKKDGVYCKYQIKGYHGEFTMLWDYVKGQIELRMHHYLHHSSSHSQHSSQHSTHHL